MTNEQLCALAKQGNADAQNLLIENNLRFIKKTAFEVWNTRAQFNRSLCIDVEDLVQEGSMGLYDCIEKFDPDSGNQFLTYAVPAIKNAMLDYVRSQSSSFEGKNQSEIMSLDEFAKDEVQSRHTFIPDAATQTPEQVYLAQERLKNAGFRVLTHHRIPANDGGIALGQAIYAMRRLQDAGH